MSEITNPSTPLRMNDGERGRTITQKSLEHLAELSRLELTEHEKEKLLKDLESILSHFKELEAVDTQDVQPMAGGTTEKNAMRDDEERIQTLSGERSVEQFPEKEQRYLKIPPVFE